MDFHFFRRDFCHLQWTSLFFLYWVGPVPYLELFWVGPIKKITLYFQEIMWKLWGVIVRDMVEWYSPDNNDHVMITIVMIMNMQYYVKSRESRHLGNGTSDHRNENPKTLFNTNYPPKPGENHLRNHFRPLESVFSAIATYKTRDFSKSPKCPILIFGGVK